MTPFFDRNLGSSVPRAIRLVGRVIHYHDGLFRPDMPDTEIISETASREWVFFTRDKRIRRRTGELLAIRDSKAKCVVLAQRAPLTSWKLLQRVVCSWDEIEGTIDGLDGPIILNVYQDGRLAKVDL